MLQTGAPSAPHRRTRLPTAAASRHTRSHRARPRAHAAAGAALRSLRLASSCLWVGSFTLVASPSFCRPQIRPHVASTSHHSRPWRADHSNAAGMGCGVCGGLSCPAGELVGRL